MTRRTLVLALVAAALGGVWFATRDLRWEIEPELPAAAVTPRERPIVPSVAERLAQIDARLRLPPDRRAIAAIGEIRRLVHGGAATPAEASYAGGSWKISREGELVGMLSDFPRFAALLSLLDEQAARERRKPGAVQLVDELEIRPELQDRLNHFDDAEAFAVLAEVDARWRERHASVGDLLAATDALAQLSLLLPHDTAATDRLQARAFASLALARQYFADRTLRAEVALAFATGYATHARAIAERLPRDEPLAAYVRADLASLERASRPADAGHVDFFYGSRLLWWRGDDAWLTWYRALPTKRAERLVVVGTALDGSGAATRAFAPDHYTGLLLDRFGAPRASDRCAAVAERSKDRARAFAGPFADAALFADVYRTACRAAEAHALDAQPLKESEVARALASLELESAPRQAMARRAIAALAKNDPGRRRLADLAATGLDSRASGRLFAGELARDAYRDPGLEERLYAAAVDVYGAEHGWLLEHVAAFRRDWLGLWSIAESDGYHFDDRLAALGALEEQKPLETERLRRGYERLLQEAPESEPLRRQLARFFEKGLGNRRAARNALLPLLSAHGASEASTDAIAGLVARLHLAEGHADQAWAVLEPRLDHVAVQLHVVRAQVAMNDLGRAEEIARAAHARYPQSLPVAAELCSVLWEAGKNAEAAQVIAEYPPRPGDTDRCASFCRAFVRTFKGRPAVAAQAAFAALVGAKLDGPLLVGTVETFRSAAEAETAFALVNKSMNVPIPEMDVEGYKSLKQVKGEAEAVRWMSGRIPRERLAEVARVFYFRDADELLWKLFDEPEPQGGSATWLLRAAAFAREREPDPAHRAALAAWFGAHQETADEQLGAALVGLIEPERVLERSRSEVDLGKAAYFLGTRAEAARDFKAAMRLYQLALAAPQRTPGRDLADAAVARIQRRNASFEALAAERAPRAIVAAGR